MPLLRSPTAAFVFPSCSQLRDPKHLCVGDIFLESIASNAHLILYTNGSEGITKLNLDDFLLASGIDLGASWTLFDLRV